MIVFNTSSVPGPLGWVVRILGLVLILSLTAAGLVFAVVGGAIYLLGKALGLFGGELQPKVAPKAGADSIVVEDADGKTIATLPRYS